MRISEVSRSEVREVEPAPEAPPDAAKPGLGLSRRGTLILGVAAAVFLIVIAAGFRTRQKAAEALKAATLASAVPTVGIVHPVASSEADQIVLPANTQAFTDAPIFARTTGYVRSWSADIGQQVKKGQLLAVIETPEVDQELQQARADLQMAEANLKQAQITADRWQALLQTDSVSQQETDQAVSTLHATKATVASNASNVRRLEELQGFQRIDAPFDGVITARNTDIGALINSGAGTPGRELFHISAIHMLRVFINVPQVYSPAVHEGSEAYLTLDEFPGRKFPGTVARSSSSIDPASRTLLVEVDVDNRDGRLLPGAYARVHLQLPQAAPSVTIPSNTLLFRAEGLRVGVVRNGRAVLVPVTLGRDFGNTVEVVEGLQPSDQVILNPSDSLINGASVRVGPSPAAASKAASKATS